MIKLFCSTLFIFLLMAASVHSEAQIIDEDYLSKVDRATFVKIHLNHLEAQALRAKITNFPSVLEIEGALSHSTVYRQLSDFLLAAAYAENREGICIFGGWPSFKINGICKTPWNFSGEEELSRIGPTYSSDYYCGGKNLFRCSPVLFGGGSDGKGHCITIQNYDNLTLSCFEKSKETPEEIYDKYRNDPTYRNQYLNMIEEVAAFCSVATTYDACRSLIASVSSAKRFVCQDQTLDQLLGSERFLELENVWGNVEGELIQNSGRAKALGERVINNVEVAPLEPILEQTEIDQIDAVEGDFAAYSNSPQVKAMIERLRQNTRMVCSGQSQSNCRPSNRNPEKPTRWCWRHVKLGLLAGDLVDDYIPSQYAVEAAQHLRKRGFVNLAQSPKHKNMTPETAPPGAIIVYRNTSDPRGEAGHVEVKTHDGKFVSDFEKDQPISAYNPRREVVGIFIDPDLGN